MPYRIRWRKPTEHFARTDHARCYPSKLKATRSRLYKRLEKYGNKVWVAKVKTCKIPKK